MTVAFITHGTSLSGEVNCSQPSKTRKGRQLQACSRMPEEESSTELTFKVGEKLTQSREARK